MDEHERGAAAQLTLLARVGAILGSGLRRQETLERVADLLVPALRGLVRDRPRGRRRRAPAQRLQAGVVPVRRRWTRRTAPRSSCARASPSSCARSPRTTCSSSPAATGARSTRCASSSVTLGDVRAADRRRARRLGTIALLATDRTTAQADLELISEIARRTAVALEIDRSRQASQMLFEASPTPMWVYDAESLAFLAVNDAAIRHYGYSREEFLAMTIKDIRPPEDVPRLLADVVGRRRPRLARGRGPGGTGARTARSSTSRSPPAGSTTRAAAPRSSSPTTSASASGSSAGSPTRRRWRRSAGSPAASRTTSTTC